MAKLTLQQAFDKGLNGIREQGYRASAGAGGCVYNGYDGSHCWVGHCVDPAVSAAFNNKRVSSIASLAFQFDNPMAKAFLAPLPENLEAVREMQGLHDQWLDDSPTPEKIKAFESYAEALAHRWNLDYTPPAV